MRKNILPFNQENRLIAVLFTVLTCISCSLFLSFTRCLLDRFFQPWSYPLVLPLRSQCPALSHSLVRGHGCSLAGAPVHDPCHGHFFDLCHALCHVLSDRHDIDLAFFHHDFFLYHVPIHDIYLCSSSPCFYLFLQEINDTKTDEL